MPFLRSISFNKITKQGRKIATNTIICTGNNMEGPDSREIIIQNAREINWQIYDLWFVKNIWFFPLPFHTQRTKIWRVWIQKPINANFKVFKISPSSNRAKYWTFSMISHSLHNKEYFWSYDEKYDIFFVFQQF